MPETISNPTWPDRRLRAAALRVLNGRPTDHAAECAGLAVEMCSRIGAVREAALPIRAEYDEAMRGRGWAPDTVEVSRLELWELLFAISVLSGGVDA